MYLPTKKIGKNNPKAAKIEADGDPRESQPVYQGKQVTAPLVLQYCQQGKGASAKSYPTVRYATQADTKGLFKSKERKVLTEQIQRTEKEIAEKLDKLPDVLKEDGYPDVQAFMQTFREMESVVEQYNRDLAEWERQTSRKQPPAEKQRRRKPPLWVCPYTAVYIIMLYAYQRRILYSTKVF